MREPVCLAAGLDEYDCLSEEAQTRALACLERFAERLRDLPASHLRVVGTNTLRRAENGRAFRARAERCLGHSIEVISGQEEARLIHLGVAHSHAGDALDKRLVVDIGGGSTEVILGRGFDLLRSHSLYMGCVSFSQRFFPEGQITRAGFREAELAARLELQPFAAELRQRGWDSAVGTSGTINSVAELIRQGGFSEGPITFAGLKKLRKALVAAAHAERLALPGLKPDRARVLAGGLAILIGLFKGLGVEVLGASSRSLREGVLYDLVGRIRHEDVRDRTIRRLSDQYHVDLAQATRVEGTARALLEAARPLWWGAGEPPDPKPLVWACRLHEIGLAVSFTGFHRHGAYLVAHSDMQGFSEDDQQLLAALIGGQRRKLSKTLFAGLAPEQAELARRLTVILRLAALLNRGRSAEAAPPVALGGEEARLVVAFPPGWLVEHPLTETDLRAEAEHLARGLGLLLEFTDDVPLLEAQAGATAPRES